MKTFHSLPSTISAVCTSSRTGCLAAWAFGIRRRTAFPAIVLGVLVAGVIVTLLTELVREFPFIGD